MLPEEKPRLANEIFTFFVWDIYIKWISFVLQDLIYNSSRFFSFNCHFHKVFPSIWNKLLTQRHILFLLSHFWQNSLITPYIHLKSDIFCSFIFKWQTLKQRCEWSHIRSLPQTLRDVWDRSDMSSIKRQFMKKRNKSIHKQTLKQHMDKFYYVFKVLE